jgi:hypothetical protein
MNISTKVENLLYRDPVALGNVAGEKAATHY